MKNVVLIALCISLFYGCGTDPLSGGSSDHGNSRVAGIIKDRYGDPLPNATVELIPDNYNHLTDSSSALLYTTTTDENGAFSFDSVFSGNYTISGKSEYSEIGFTQKCQVDDTILITDVIIADAFGSIYMETDSLNLPQGSVIFFPGLRKYSFIDKPTAMVFTEVPKGIIQIKGYDPTTGKTIDLGKEYLCIEIIPGNTLILPSRSPKPFCVKGESILTCPQGHVNDTFSLSIVDPALRIDGNWSYRISWGDGSISNWTFDNKLIHVWTKKGIYPVQSQVLFHGQYLAWSDPVLIEIIDR
ncbi:MAG TPA: carboxypeptidase-like regulatory domain-containing protein [Chitinispirillaceae bacterium]|nr:carboxypeptidase-like regulatory domain-containing protein [Chitinispirillaceae bacterium]